MRLGALVIEEPGSRVFCVTGVAAGSVCNSRASCFCSRSTKSRVEACNAPEHVHVIRRRVKDVARAPAGPRAPPLETSTAAPSWSASRNTCRTAPMASRVRERRPEAIAFTLTKTLYLPGIHRAEPAVGTARSGPRTPAHALGHTAPSRTTSGRWRPSRRLENCPQEATGRVARSTVGHGCVSCGRTPSPTLCFMNARSAETCQAQRMPTLRNSRRACATDAGFEYETAAP